MANGSVSRSICDKPRKNIFCGPDKYLRLVTHTITERTFPILEDDSFFLYVEKGCGKFTLNGVSFDVVPGCICWIQCSHVLTVEPEPGETMFLWSYVYDYQLSNFLMFRTATQKEHKAVVYGTPILWPGSERVGQLQDLFRELKDVDKMTNYGSSLIKVSMLGQMTVFFAQEAEDVGVDCEGSDWPLGWRACMYVAAHSMGPLEAEDAAKALGTDIPSLNRELRMVTGLNFEQNLSRLRCIMAASYFLYENLPLDYVAVHSGFKSEVTFYRCFRKTMNMTPREYRDHTLYDTDGRYRGLIMDETLVSVVNYLYDNLSEQISVDSMAKALFTSGSIIRNLLDSSFGAGYKDVLNLFRIRYSESLLASTSLPILDVSVMVGFNSDRTYSRIFSSINGISPSEYRQLCRRNRGERVD